MKIICLYEREELNNLQFPIIVEQWTKFVGHSASGRNRRLYEQTFTETERNTLKRYYRLFYNWYLKTGTPNYRKMSPKTYMFLNEAVEFFATH